MPSDATSPFTPGQPVPVELFVGREDEIKRLMRKVRNAADGKLSYGFLTGERGIGKSSLASFVRILSERQYGVLGLHTFLGGVTTLEDMTRKVMDTLLKESIDAPWYSKIANFFGDHVQEIGLFNISLSFKAPDEDLKQLVRSFAPAIRNIARQIKNEKKGIFLIFDDINGLASSSDFANWIKSLIDEIATSQKPIPLCILLVGLEERRNSLISLQPSLDRILDPVEIIAWSEYETAEFFNKNFSKVGYKVEEAALELFVKYTGGLPFLSHEIGDAAFNIDNDSIISKDDALNAILAAAETVGRKHLQPKVYKAIGSPHYKNILRKITKEDAFGFHFRRSDVISKLSNEEKNVFDNFLRRMRKLGVLSSDLEGERGSYVFSNRLHNLYFFLEALKSNKS